MPTGGSTTPTCSSPGRIARSPPSARLFHHRHVQQRPLHRRFARSPLGPGNSARLRNGMRLRLGDYVLWVEVMQESQPSRSDTRPPAAAPPPRPASLPPVNFDTDDFFSKQSEEEPADRARRICRAPSTSLNREPTGPSSASAAPSIAFDDPFSLDPVATPQQGARPDRQAPASAADPFGFGAAAPMDPSPVAPPPEDRRPAAEARPSPAPWNLPDEPPAAPPPASPAKKAPAPQSRPAPASAAPAGNDRGPPSCAVSASTKRAACRAAMRSRRWRNSAASTGR